MSSSIERIVLSILVGLVAAGFFAVFMAVVIARSTSSGLGQGPTAVNVVPRSAPSADVDSIARKTSVQGVAGLVVMMLILFRGRESALVAGITLGGAVTQTFYLWSIRRWERRWNARVLIPAHWRFRGNFYFLPDVNAPTA